MNVQRIPEYLLRWGVTLGGILLALFLAKSVGDGRTGFVATVLFGMLGVIVALILREKVWIFIPMCWPLIGKITVLPIPFTVRDIVTMYVFVAVLTLLAFKLIRRSARVGLLDLLFLVNILWIAGTFIRNPVGFESTDSVRVGGRPYFETAIACLGLWTLSRMSSGVRLMRTLPWLVFGAVAFVFCLNLVVFFAPMMAPVIAPLYSGLDLGSYAQLDAARQAEMSLTGRRYEMFRDIGRYGSVLLCAYSYPPHLLLPLRAKFWAMTAIIGGLLLSGFRSFLVYFGGMFFIGTWLRNGINKALLYGSVALLLAVLVIIGHGTLYHLPFAAQRAFSFLPEALTPGNLDRLAIETGTSSTKWRTDMWKEALTTNRYIDNHWLGDGFGFSKRQLDAIYRIQFRPNTFEETQETMAVVGDFHSGPVSSIRVAGYIGFGLVMLLIVMLALRAYKLIMAARGTPFFQPALFFGMPILFEPFWFTFIFGSYAAAITFSALGLGMVKLIENSLAEWRRQEPAVAPGEAVEKSGNRPVIAETASLAHP